MDQETHFESNSVLQSLLYVLVCCDTFVDSKHLLEFSFLMFCVKLVFCA